MAAVGFTPPLSQIRNEYLHTALGSHEIPSFDIVDNDGLRYVHFVIDYNVLFVLHYNILTFYNLATQKYCLKKGFTATNYILMTLLGCSASLD